MGTNACKSLPKNAHRTFTLVNTVIFRYPFLKSSIACALVDMMVWTRAVNGAATKTGTWHASDMVPAALSRSCCNPPFVM
jgi:hypothetical protein